MVIPKHATWAWRPAPPPEKLEKNDGRKPVVSRDVITDDGRRESRERDSRIDNETFRLAIAPISNKPCDQGASIRLTIPQPPISWSTITSAFTTHHDRRRAPTQA